MKDIVDDLMVYFTYILVGTLDLALNFPHLDIYIHFFKVLTWSLIMEDIQLEVQINTWDNSSVWVNQDTLETSSIFVREGCLYHAFTKVGTFWRLWAIVPEEDKRTYNKYDGCVAPLLKFLFFFIRFPILLNDFEVNVLTIY